jgi:threonine synthase
MIILCNNCHRPYPEMEFPYCCPVCGGVYDFPDSFDFVQHEVGSKVSGMWRYRHTFGLPKSAPDVTLGEGDTPLVWIEALDRKIGLKLEYLNPTGSFKDRGTAVMVSHLLSRGVQEAIEDSSGNAGASFAAYSSRVGLLARVYVPDYASRSKRAQISAYGAEVVRILGPRSNAAEAVKRAAEDGAVYASHAHLPHGIPGFSTVAYEIVEQLGDVPGTIITPVGQGLLLLGASRGFKALHRAGIIPRVPVLVGVQAKACAPLWALSTSGMIGLSLVTEGDTIAEGVRIKFPLRGDALLQAVSSTNGRFVAVDEEKIITGRDELARRGFFVEPTSAIVWDALTQVIGQVPEPIVVLLTGSGLKSIP